MRAGELREGERLRTLNGTAEIVSTARKPGVHRVYNLEVQTEHTYFVSKIGVLVHNVAGCGQPGARFIADENSNIVDTQSTPRGSYDQPNGGRTDILQQGDHGAGYSHTHDPVVNTNPKTGESFINGLSKPGRPVSFEDVKNIESGAAPPSCPKGR